MFSNLSWPDVHKQPDASKVVVYMTERAKIRGVWLKQQGEDNQILKNSKNSRKPQNSLEGILLYHILITVELDLNWVKDINVSVRNFYR